MLLIALLCSLNLRPPICLIRLAGVSISAPTIVPMPIASMDKDCDFLLGEYYIRLSWESFVIDPIAVSQRKQILPHHKFNTGVLALDMRHNLAPPLRRNRIGHYTDKSKGRSEISFSRFPWTSVSNVSTASSDPTSLTARISS